MEAHMAERNRSSRMPRGSSGQPPTRVHPLLAAVLAAWLAPLPLAFGQTAASAPPLPRPVTFQAPPPALALPTGAVLRSGTGNVSETAPGQMRVDQASPRLGLDWQSFSIGSGARVQFVQPDANAVALNRVVGGEASQIFGRLDANGQVFLVNPAGVLFARGAQVDVGGLVASTLDLSQADFAAGRNVFRGESAAAVVNEGELRASHGGYVALFGRDVANRGEVRVDAGTVLLASGSAATVSLSGHGLLSATVAPGSVAGQVLNEGRLQADGGTVRLQAHSAQALAGSLVNSSGIVRADTLVERGGEIWITGDSAQVSGPVSAAAPAGGDGGTVHVLGDMQRGRVAVSGRIDASSAQGRGGFVDTSAATVKVADSTRVTTLGRSVGMAGTWLIDPPDYVIAPSGGDITGATLSANLSGGNVVIQSSNGASGTAGNINVNDTVSWSANRLTLQAQNDINVNQPLVGSGTAQLTFEFGLQAVAAGNTSRVNVNAPVGLPSGPNFSTRQGSNGATVNFTVITTLAGLQALDGDTTVLGGNYALGADIDAIETLTSNGGLGFNPIGNEAATSFNGSAGQAFTGQLDGLGHRITGLNVNRPAANYIGLFAITNNAVVRNLELSGSTSVAGSYAGGGFVGAAHGTSVLSNLRSNAQVTVVDDSNSGVWAGGVAGWVQGTGTGGIERASASGAVSATSPTATAYVGGVVGEVEGGFARDLSASGNVTATRPAGGAGSTFYVGGAVGSTDIGLLRATASGTVTGGQRAGGLVGSSSTGSIVDSSASGSVTTSANSGSVYVGGLVGAMGGTGSVENAVARGDVSITSTAGDAGGLIGYHGATGTLTNVEAQGAVSGGDTAGGLIGTWAASATITSFTLTNAPVSSATWAGGFIGYVQSTASWSGIQLGKNVSATGSSGSAGGLFGRSFGSIGNSSSSGNVSGNYRVGGLVGQADGGPGASITGSNASGTVTHTDTSGDAGGLVGYSSIGSVSGSTASGSVSGGSQTGGLIGQTTGTSITGVAGVATATGNVTNSASGVTTYTGGLVGYFSTGTLTDVRADGNVSSTGATGTNDVGGLVGEAQGTGSVTRAVARGNVSATAATGTVGGLFGQYGLTGDINTVEARGQVEGGRYTGGLVGYANTAGNWTGITLNDRSVTGAEWVGGVVGQSVGGGGITGVTVAKPVVANGASANAGGLAGYFAGPIGSSTATGTVQGNNYVGGLVGQQVGGASATITGSLATGNVTSTDASGSVGGLVGYTSGGAISSSRATGTVQGGGSTGGLVGEAAGNSVSISGVPDVATASGSVTGSTYVGGVVGYFGANGNMTDLRADGNVSGITNVGGVIGYSSGSNTGQLTNAIANGNVSASANTGSVGGVAGYLAYSGGVSGAHSRGTVSGGLYTGGLIGYSDVQGVITGSTVALTSLSGSGWVGGFIGYHRGAGELRNLSSAVGITAAGSGAGGLAGLSQGPITGSSASGSITGTGSVGGLVGELAGNATIATSSATGNVTNTTTGGYAGGLVGYAYGAGVSGSTAGGRVEGGTYTGGLIGYFSRQNGSVSGNTATGNVVGTWDLGGLIGNAAGGGTASVQNNVATGTVTSSSSSASVGGLIGYTTLSGGISGNEARGNVSGGSYTGGLVGFYNVATAWGSGNTYVGTQVTGADWVGGLVGYSIASEMSGVSVATNVTATRAHAGGVAGYTQGSVTNATATGNVTGRTYIGGLVGYANGNVTLTDVTARGNVSGGDSTQAHAGGLVGYAGGPAILRGRAFGAVDGNSYAGGLVGYFAGTGSNGIRNSSAEGSVGGTGDVGGLVGYATGSGGVADVEAKGRVLNSGSANSVGGIAGEFYMAGGMSNAVASGQVSGGDYTGGLAGTFNSAGPITGSRYTQPTISGGSRTGGLFGSTTQLALDLTGQTITTQVSGSGSAGGVVGYATGSLSISGGTAGGAVSSSGSHAGGLIGYASASGSITGARAAGNISSNGYAGGLGGLLIGLGVSDSHATGNVTVVAASAFAGGLIGQHGVWWQNSGSISGSTASGTVTTDAGTSYSGGLVGQADRTSISASSASGQVLSLDAGSGTAHYNGGLIGYMSGTGSITNSHATGNVTGRTHAGGLVGYFTADRIVGSSASGNVSGQQYVGGLAGLSQSQGTQPHDNIWATGSVTGNATSDYVGGLIGRLLTNGVVNGRASGSVTTAAATDYVGGLIGEANLSGAASSVNDSSATGTVTGGNTTGGLIGRFVSSVASGGVVNSWASGNVGGNTIAGGLIGEFNSYGTGASAGLGIRNSWASGNVTGTRFLGGLVGEFDSSRGISQSWASGSVTSRGAGSSDLFLGGLVGQYRFYNQDANTTGVVRSYATGRVGLTDTPDTNSSTDTYAGGLIGQINQWTGVGAVAVTDSYASGGVRIDLGTGRVRIGGLVGQANSSLLRTYAVGAVAGTGNATYNRGGLVGEKNSNAAVVVTDSHWDTERSGQATSAGGGSGRTTAEMRALASFGNWSITASGGGSSTWRIYPGFTEPLLANFLTPATIALADLSKQYDGTTSFGNASVTANVPIDHPDRIFVAGIGKDVGSYAVTAANVYSTQNGYDLTLSGSATLTVVPRPLTLAGVVADKVYDGNRNATVVGNAQPSGLVPGEDLAVDIGNVTALFSDKNAGTNKTVTVTGYTLGDGVIGRASNYSLGANTSTTASIAQAPLTAGGFTAVNRVYDGTTIVQVNAGGGDLTGIIGNDQVALDLSGVSTGTVASKVVGTNKPVTVLGVALTGADAANYRVAGVDGVTVNVTPRPVVVNSLVGVNRSYDATTNVQVNTGTGVISGLVAGDVVELVGNNVAGRTADKNAGVGKAVTVTGAIALRGPDAANYTASAGTTTVDIARAIAYSDVNRVTGTDRIYDGTPDATVRVDLYGVFSGDDLRLTFDAPRFADKNVAYDANGNVTGKTITVTGLAITGNDAANYTLNTTLYGNTASGTISPRQLGVTGVAAINRVYDGTRNVNVDVTNANVDLTAKIPTDEVFVSLPAAGTVVGTIPNKNAGTARPVTVPGFTLTGADARNYSITGTSGVTVDIARRDVTASYTGRDRVYDGRTWAGVVASTSDFVAGDDISFYSNDFASLYTQFPTFYATPGVFTDNPAKNVGQNKPVRVTYDELRGNDRNNYNFVNAQNNTGTFGTTTASVTPKPIADLRFTAASRAYDGTTAAQVSLDRSGSGFAFNDNITSTQTAVFADKNVGDGKAIAVTGVQIAGTDAFNYTVTDSTGATTANITAKAVAVSGITAVNRPYDGTNVVAVTAGTLGSSGFVANDDVRVEPPAGGITSGTVPDRNIGTARPVTVTGLTLAGNDAGNYVIDPAASGIVVDITRRAITTSWLGVDRVYTGGVTASVIGSSPDIVAGDSVGFSQFAVFTGADARNVGTNKPIAITDIALTGASSGNYTLASTTASATASITPKPVNVSYAATSRVYNGLADRSIPVQGSSNDLVGNDTVGFEQTALLRTDGAAGAGKAVDITGISLTGAQARNYSLVSNTATTTATILQRPIGITGITGIDRIYDGTLQVAVNVGNVGVDLSSVIAGDDVRVQVPPGGISSGTMLTKDVGVNKPVQVTGLTIDGAQGSNYTVASATGITVDIGPRPLTAVYTPNDKVYDGSAVVTLLASSADILPLDLGSVGISASAAFTAGKNAGAGKAVAISGGFLTGPERGNYTLLNPGGTATATITQRTLTPTFSGVNKVYDGTALAAVTSTTAGIVAGDQLSLQQSAVFSNGKNVGTGKPIAVSGISLAGLDAPNYALSGTTASASANVTARPITIAGLGAIQATPRVYDRSTAVQLSLPTGVVLVPDSSDIVAGDTVTIELPGNIATGTMADKNAGVAKPVRVDGLQLSGTDATNYTIAGTAGITVTISPRPLTALYAGLSRVYDGTANVAVTGSSADVLAGDSLLVSGSGVFTGPGAKNAGNDKPIEVRSATLGGEDRLNYALQNPTGTALGRVTQRDVTPSYVGGTRIYDGTTTAPVTGSATGFIAGDDIGLSQTASFADRNVGADKPVQVSGIALAGTDAANYRLLATSAVTTGRITPRPVDVLGLTGVTAVDRVYDGTTTVALNIGVNGVLQVDPNDVIGSDAVTVVTPPPGQATGTMADKHAGTGKLLQSISGLTLSGADSANYSIAAAAGVTVNIARRVLDPVFTGVDRVYDGTTTAQVTGSATGVVAGDLLTIGGSGSFTGAGARNAGSNKPIAVSSATLAGADARNYELSTTSGNASANVLRKTVQARYTTGSKVYDGSADAVVSGTIEGLIAGDAASLTQTASFTGPGARNAGDNKPVAVIDIALTGADAVNYTLASNSASGTASITRRPVSLTGVTGITAVNRTYDGTTLVAVNIGAQGAIDLAPGDRVAGDDVGVSVPGSGTTTGTMADKHVGTAKQVQVTGLALVGADAANYTLLGGNTAVTVDITPRPLTAQWSALDKVYDGTTLASVLGNSGDLIAGDAITLLAGGLFVGDGARNVGAGKSVNVGDGRLDGADARNYTLLNTSGTATASITPRTVQAAYAGGSRVYDGSTAAPVTGRIDGLVAGDSLGLTQTATFTGPDAKAAGDGKAVAVSGIALSGNDFGNYRLASDSATTTASVTRRGVTVTGLSGLAAVDRVYDGTRSVVVNVGGSGTVGTSPGDIVAGDDVAVAGTAAGTTSGTMADKHAGPNKAVAVTGLTLSGADAANYQITATAGLTVNIAPRAVQLSGVSAIDRVYDGTRDVALDTSAGRVDGVLAGDDLQLRAQGARGEMADKNAGSNKPVALGGLAFDGADARNYIVQGADALRVNIAQRLLTLTAQTADKVYDGSTNAALTLADDRIAGDRLTLPGAAARFADKNVGTDKLVTVGGLALGDTDAGNYRLGIDEIQLRAAITPRSLNLRALDQRKVYGDTLTLAGSEFGATGLVAGETVGSVQLTSDGTAGSAGVGGSPYRIAIANPTGGSFDARNYSITLDSGLLTVTPRPLTVTAASVVRETYLDNPGVPRPTLSAQAAPGDLVNGDTVLGGTVPLPPGSDDAPGGSIYALTPTAVNFGQGTPANYDIRFVSGLLVVLPRAPRIGDTSGGTGGGSGDNGFALVEIDRAQVQAGLLELGRVGNAGAGLPLVPPQALARSLDGSALPAAIAALLAQAREGTLRLSLAELLRLPLMSFDPQWLRDRQPAEPAR
jgi:filamentous hemagglutinin family protein